MKFKIKYLDIEVEKFSKNAVVWNFISIAMFIFAGMEVWSNIFFALALCLIGLFCNRIYEVNVRFHAKLQQ